MHAFEQAFNLIVDSIVELHTENEFLTQKQVPTMKKA